MKKRVSLFLALLMVFSVLFATSAEAARIKPTVDEQSQNPASAVTVREEVKAPCVTDLDQPGDFTMGTAGCSHSSWGFVPANGSYHNKICNLCGNILARSTHNFSYVYCVTYHKKVCGKCGYTVKQNHNSYDPLDANTHLVKCSLCGYHKAPHRYATGMCWCLDCGYVDRNRK